MMQIILIMILPLVIAPRLAYGVTYYVAKTGNNYTSCEQAQSVYTPKLTIAAGLACMKGSDTLIVKDGTYNESITDAQLPDGMSNTNRTILRAQTRLRTILMPTSGAHHAVWLQGNKWVTFDGLVIDGELCCGGSGLYIQNGGKGVLKIPTGITFQNGEIRNARKNCIGVQNQEITNVKVINNKLHHCGRDKFDHGVYLSGSNHLVEHNEIYNIAGHGVHQYHKYSTGSDNLIVRYNYIHDNGSRGILIGSGNNNIAENNLIQSNGKQTGEGGITIGFQSPENNQVYDNTIYSNSGDCIVIRRRSVNSKVTNNICGQNDRDSVRDQGQGSFIGPIRVINRLADATTALVSPFRSKYLSDPQIAERP